MLGRVIFSWGESEPQCWGLTEAGLAQWPGVSHQPRGRANCTKDRGEPLQDLYSHFSDTERSGRARLPNPKLTHESHTSLSGCQSIRECTRSQGRQPGRRGAANQGCGIFFTLSCAKHCWPWAGRKSPPSQPPHATALASLTLQVGGSKGAGGQECFLRGW